MGETAQLEESPSKPTINITDSGSTKAEKFIQEWNDAFSLKVFQMPHLAKRCLHTIVGLMLRDVKLCFQGSYTDLRDSSIIMQDSGTGKKPTIEFLEGIAKKLGFKFRRRSTITSAGAVGTVVIEDIIDSDTNCKIKAPVVVDGDLKTLDLLTCSEADSILYSRIDAFGNDLLTNLCDSQDAENQISKKLANGEVEPFTSKTTLFLTTTVPKTINPRWFEKGLFQRFGISIKTISFEQYQDIRNEIFNNLGKGSDSTKTIDDLVTSLKVRPIPKHFEISEEIKGKLLEKAKLLDQMLIDLKNPEIQATLKSFTNRRDLKLVVYACHHAWLDERNELNGSDVEYAFEVSRESWNDILNFIGHKTSEVKSCREAILGLMADGKTRKTDDIAKSLPTFKRNNIYWSLSNLKDEGKLAYPERDTYRLNLEP